MPLLLGVNIDHIATLRQARYAKNSESHLAEPSPLDAVEDALAGGGDSITIHVRGDRRHMQEHDAFAIRQAYPCPLNFEMGVTEEMVEMVLRLRPEYVCLVPETREEITTEGGLDILAGREKIATATKRLQAVGIKVSFFIDPELDQVKASADLGADMIELHTGCFANAEGDEQLAEVDRLRQAATLGHSLGLQVNAGHGINYENIRLILKIPHLTELNIGHSIVARSTRVGLSQAVREMKQEMAAYPY